MSNQIELRIPNLQAHTPYVAVLLDRGVIRSITIHSNKHKFNAISMNRFLRWGGLFFRSPPGSPVSAAITVQGDDLIEGSDPLFMPDPAEFAGALLAGASNELTGEIAEQLERNSWRACDVAQRLATRYFQDLDTETNPRLFGDDDGRRCIRPERCADRGALESTIVKPLSLDGSVLSLEKQFRAALIQEEELSVGSLLWSRLERRAYGTGQVRSDIASRSRIAYLSALQLEVLNDHFGDQSRAAVARSYEMFACGDLQLKMLTPADYSEIRCLSNGAPNSALAFCFAEFAFLAIEMGIDAKQWKRHLPALVAVQEIYPLAYGDLYDDGQVRPIDADQYNQRSTPRSMQEPLRRSIGSRYQTMPYQSLPIVSHENIRRAISRFSVLPKRTKG
jgi:hypothetical protein